MNSIRRSCLFFAFCAVFFWVALLVWRWGESFWNGATVRTTDIPAKTLQGQPVLSPDNQPVVQPDQTRKLSTVQPISHALSRITKKPFGIYVAPKHSPVQPERFLGYHTGVDFETSADEQMVDVPIVALCNGKVLMARTAGGYGGVAVQGCVLDGQRVTVVYGHIRLASVQAHVGNELRAGDFLANLGTGFSSETDGERKHLHLGIHKGTVINIAGYVQSKDQLASWIDPMRYFQ